MMKSHLSIQNSWQKRTPKSTGVIKHFRSKSMNIYERQSIFSGCIFHWNAPTLLVLLLSAELWLLTVKVNINPFKIRHHVVFQSTYTHVFTSLH